MRILLNISKKSLQLNNLTSPKRLTQNISGDPKLSSFGMTVLEKLIVANVCFCSNDYAYDESPLITYNDARMFRV